MATDGKAAMRTYLRHRQGPVRVPFDAFFHGFIVVFDMTKSIKEIANDKNKDTIEKIEKWATHTNNLTDPHILQGFALYDAYVKILQENKLIAFQKVA